MANLVHDFANVIQNNSELARQHVWFIKAKHDQQKRDDALEQKEQNTFSLANEVVLATEVQLRAFNVKLYEYEAATTAALMENQKQLDAVTEQINLMLAQAYVMPDGRRVFKTEDGTQVFDEFGVAVLSDELEPTDIPDSAPTWEAFSSAMSDANRLDIERGQLIAYQQKLDDARELVSEGDISDVELSELESDLDKMMPLSVRSQLPPIENADKAPAIKEEFTAGATGIDAEFQAMELELEALLPK
jgi:hypothetical protein